jgi:histidine triad (HIT) family protein
MATLFTRIIDGEIPGRFVWRDDQAVVFLTIAPIAPGHVLVVPREEVDHWIDLDPDLAAHLMEVAQKVGEAQMAAFGPTRIGLIIAGLEVPHAHVHLVPIDTEADLSFARADHDPNPTALDDAAQRLRAALRKLGYGADVPDA